MALQTGFIRTAGGRDASVSFDGTTITVAGQTVALASLSAALQAQFTAAIGAITSGTTTATHPAFGGSNVQSAVAAIMDALPGFASSVTAALLAQRDDGQALRS